MRATIKTQTESGLVRVLYGRELGDPLPRDARARVSRAAVVLTVAHRVGVFAVGVAIGLAILLAAGALAGCSTTDERREHLIRAGKTLVRHWGEPDWTSRRDTWLAAAEIECPEPSATAEVGK